MTIEIGTKVTFRVNCGLVKTCLIVYDGESNLAQDRISHSAPLAQLMLGRKEGEVARGNVPAGEVTIEIIKVEKAT